MKKITKRKIVGKKDSPSRKEYPFTIDVAETEEDVKAICVGRAKRPYHYAKGEKIEVDYLTYCFNYGHDLVTRTTVGDDKASAASRRMKTLAWVSQQEDYKDDYKAVMELATKAGSMEPLWTWLDEEYMGNEEEIEEFVREHATS